MSKHIEITNGGLDRQIVNDSPVIPATERIGRIPRKRKTQIVSNFRGKVIYIYGIFFPTDWVYLSRMGFDGHQWYSTRYGFVNSTKVTTFLLYKDALKVVEESESGAYLISKKNR